jgi:hypothetical protein
MRAPGANTLGTGEGMPSQPVDHRRSLWLGRHFYAKRVADYPPQGHRQQTVKVTAAALGGGNLMLEKKSR